ncbi:hypothetical protein Agabi119p4_5106 [Agaricus bisporus var. burnettii]|uniref:Uncharacterized protein n=1 Tax=Agaricus bisporus var. burnettii TaxID=192524 RepID=A0A8H7F4L0_AGABI|nr:hypothetical protein Agabi119p4_5106 [Agaricus bisporus var. burnettii]
MVASETFRISMLGHFVEGTQSGGYRPRVVSMEKEMEVLTERMRAACQGRTGCPAEKVMADLKEMEYRALSWDGINPTLLVDENERVFGALVGQPVGPGWEKCCTELYEIMLAEQEAGAKHRPAKSSHRRGDYVAIHAGITHALGLQQARYLHLTKRESKLVYGNSRKWKLKNNLKKFANTSLDLFSPRLFKYYTEHMEKLRAHPEYKHLP